MSTLKTLTYRLLLYDIQNGVNHKNSNNNIYNTCYFKVDPVFMDSDNVAGDLKVAFNMKFALTCSSPSVASSISSSWVKHPDHLDLMYVSRHFLVAVDPTGLPSGVHSAYVAAYDVTAPNKV